MSLTLYSNPMGKVPAIHHNGVIVTETAAITDRTCLAGNNFSAADVYVGSQIGFGLMFGTVPQRPTFEAYFRALSARPAYHRAAALDDAEIAAQSATS